MSQKREVSLKQKIKCGFQIGSSTSLVSLAEELFDQGIYNFSKTGQPQPFHPTTISRKYKSLTRRR